MTEFKAGDRVRHVSTHDTGDVLGSIAPRVGRDAISVRWDDGETLWAWPSNLELIEPSGDEWKTDLHQDLVNHMRDLLQDWKDTFDKKQRAYGPKAIANAPLGAAEGLLNRIHDKYSRLVQLMQNPDVDDLGEAVRDTVQDMGIYCAMLVLVKDGKWPGV